MRRYAHPERVWPELDMILLSFMAHFVWEFLQAPLYASFHGVDHLQGILICTRAAMGDVVIALLAFWATAWTGGGRHWVAAPTWRQVAVFLAAGLVLTLALEYLHTEITGRWRYGPDMPTLPLIGTGLAPLIQWIIVPLLVLWFLMRLHRT